MNCIDNIDHPKIKIEENNRAAIFLNPRREKYKRGKIDGCLVNEGIRADYFISGEGKTVLVELKGCNVAHATAQLLKAAKHDKVKPHLVGKTGFLIICSRYPSHDTTVQIAMARIRKDFGAKLLVFCREREVEMAMF